MNIILEVVEHQRSKFYKVNKAAITIGRDASKCDIVITESGSSKAHCSLEFHKGRWWLFDLDSKNGTFINNMEIKRTQIYIDDVIQIGEAYIRFATSKMSIADCQLLKRPGKKKTMNRSITLVQGSNNVNKEKIASGNDHHGLKEFTGIYDDRAPASKNLLEKKVKKKKIIKKKKVS